MHSVIFLTVQWDKGEGGVKCSNKCNVFIWVFSFILRRLTCFKCIVKSILRLFNRITIRSFKGIQILYLILSYKFFWCAFFNILLNFKQNTSMWKHYSVYTITIQFHALFISIVQHILKLSARFQKFFHKLFKDIFLDVIFLM